MPSKKKSASKNATNEKKPKWTPAQAELGSTVTLAMTVALLSGASGDEITAVLRYIADEMAK